jgi:Ser/Thr protein kinase RdoA (MazF antagonist)
VSGHLVHGMGTALQAPTWPVITDVEADAVLAQFRDAGRFTGLRWHSPRPFSAAALVQTDRGEFVLKRHHALLRSPAALAPEHAFMAHLRSAGLVVPEVMTARNGAGAVSRDDWTYELQRKAEGIDLYAERPSWTPFLSHEHAYAAGQSLARLHVAARGFEGRQRAPDPLIASFTVLPARDPLAAAQAYIDMRPALARFLADKPWQAELARLFAALGNGLADRLANQPPLWTHNDWHPSNLLWSAAGGVSTVFDFGLAAPTCAVHDLATAIERSAIAWLELAQRGGDRPTDVEAAAHLIAGYRAVLPLSDDDVQTVIQLLPLVHVEFALSEAHYFAGILGDATLAQLAWQDYAIDHAEWFLSSAGQDFLAQLKQAALR